MADERVDLVRLHKSTMGLGPQEVERIAQCCEVISCQEGEILHEAGESLHALYLVSSGRLSLSAVSSTGSEMLIRQICRDDQMGLLALANDDPLPIRVRVDLNSRLLRIPEAQAEQLIVEMPIWRRNLFNRLGPRIVNAFLHELPRFPHRIVAFIHLTDESRELTQALIKRLSGLDEQIGLLTDHSPLPDCQLLGADSLIDEQGTARSADSCRSIIAQWPAADRIVFDTTVSTAARFQRQLVDACDAVFWICPTTATTMETAKLLELLVNEAPSRQEKQFVVRMLAEHEQAATLAPELRALSKREFKVHWHNEDGSFVNSRQAGMERLIHHLRGVCVGLAMGGGAARGMAHLGVLQVMQRAGIPIDCMSGTSAGALAGVLFAAGYSADYLIDAFRRDLTPQWYFRMLPYGDAWYMISKYRLGGWDRMLRKYLSDWQLEQLAIPFTSVAADLVQARQFRRTAGDATLAILESINLPGLARPICRHGMALVDGGVLNVMPADVLVEQGANVVIASDVAARINFMFAGNSPETPTDQMEVPGSAATLIRTRTVQDRNLRSLGGQAADVIIEPDVSKVQLTDFKNADKIARYGNEAAEAALTSIRAQLNYADAKLFPA